MDFPYKIIGNTISLSTTGNTIPTATSNGATMFRAICSTTANLTISNTVSTSGVAPALAQMNPASVAQTGQTMTSLVVSNNGLTVTDAGNSQQNTQGLYFADYCLAGATSGNYYFEYTVDVFYNYTYGIGVGVANPAWTLEDYIGVQTMDAAGIILGSGDIIVTNNTAASNIAATGYPSGAVSTPQTFGFAMDVDAKQLWFNIANTWYPGNPTNTTGYNASAMPTPWYPVMEVQSASPFTMSGTFNFGQVAYTFAQPAGFANLQTGGITNTYANATVTLIPNLEYIFAKYPQDTVSATGTVMATPIAATAMD